MSSSLISPVLTASGFEGRLTRRVALGFTIASLVTKGAHAAIEGGRGQINGPLGQRFWQMLQEMPYAPEHSGTQLFVIGYPTCPFCKAFHIEWENNLPGIQLNWVLYSIPSDPSTSDQEADIALTRDWHLVSAYFTRTRVAPPLMSSQARIDAYNDFGRRFNAVMAMFQQAGAGELLSPTFVWSIPGGGVGFMSGYSKAAFVALLKSSRRLTV